MKNLVHEISPPLKRSCSSGLFQLLLAIALCFSYMNVHAQQRNVSGTVKSANGESLPGVTVLVKGTTNGATSNTEGRYTVNLGEGQGSGTLVFSFIGYETQEIPLGNRTTLDVTLNDDTKALQEVVVIGYGTQKKADVTSSVASVKREEFVQGAVKDAGQLLQGKVAGLTISTPSGDPTAASQILLRGTATLRTSVQPLVLVDGVPGSLNTVAPEDIESVDVLKDGSAAAIYGTRGTNGVILITTRRAKGNVQPSVDYSGYVSTQAIARRPEMLTAADYRRLKSQGVAFDDLGSNTDWLDAATQTPLSHVHNLAFRGGNAQTNYIATGSYRYFEGIMQKSDNRSLNGRIDLNHSMFDGKVLFNLGIISNSNSYNATNNTQDINASGFNGFTYRQALIRNPTAPIRNADGSWHEQTGIYIYENPLSRLYEAEGENSAQTNRLSGSVSWLPFAGFQLKALVSQDRNNQIRGYSETKRHISTVRDTRNGFASRGEYENVGNLAEITADYNRSFGKHRVTVLGGYSYQDNVSQGFWMQNWDFPTDEFTYNNMGSGLALTQGRVPMSSDKSAWNLIGFFGRVTYTFDDKYLLMGSLRHEGSSKFVGANEPWGSFPAVSVGWRLNKESFMQNLGFLDDLKLRAGYGVTGTAPDDLFLGVARLNYSGYFFVNGKWVPTLVPVSNTNPYLQWEEKHESNAGVDFSLFKGRFGGSLDFYNRRTNGLLYDYPVPSPPNLYGTTRANVGKMDNKGIEVILNAVPVQTTSFVWNTSVNFSTNQNKLVSLENDLYQLTNNFFNDGNTGEPVQTYTHRVQVGQSIGNFYGFKVVDISEDGKWIYENASGERVPYDNFSHSDNDKKILGNGLPKYYAGWNNNVRYKNLDLGITMRGAFEYQILNFQRMYYENPGITQYNQLKTAHDKVFGKAVLNKNIPLEYNSYHIEDGGFWKVDNITLGYNFNTPVVKYIRNARVYASMLNALTFTGYQGIDPEVNRIGLTPGNDSRDKYPTTRTFTLGVNLTF